MDIEILIKSCVIICILAFFSLYLYYELPTFWTYFSFSNTDTPGWTRTGKLRFKSCYFQVNSQAPVEVTQNLNALAQSQEQSQSQAPVTNLQLAPRYYVDSQGNSSWDSQNTLNAFSFPIPGYNDTGNFSSEFTNATVYLYGYYRNFY
jgi:hypothetical protein